MTLDEINKSRCSSCIYRDSRKSMFLDTGKCLYILIEKKRRGCPSNNCNKYKKGDRIFESDFNPIGEAAKRLNAERNRADKNGEK